MFFLSATVSEAVITSALRTVPLKLRMSALYSDRPSLVYMLTWLYVGLSRTGWALPPRRQRAEERQDQGPGQPPDPPSPPARARHHLFPPRAVTGAADDGSRRGTRP